MKVTIFDEIIDNRELGKVWHDLQEVLTISLFAVLSGAEDYESIAEYGLEKAEFLSSFLELEGGLPSSSTYARIFRHLDPELLNECLKKNAEEVLKIQEKYLLNIDGKVLRGTAKKGKRNSGICILSAWAAKDNLVLGQLKASEKSNERTAIPKLLEQLDLENAIVTIDAIATTNKIAKQIVEGGSGRKGGDYILALKKNKKGLYEEAVDWLKRDREDFDREEQTDYVGGRIERRSYVVCSNLEYLSATDLLPHSKSIIKVSSERMIKEKIQKEERYYISSLVVAASQFATYIRGHWSIENQLHWQLDVSFNEDKSRIRKDNAPENMAVMRKLALQALKQMTDKSSIKRRRLKAAWNNDYLIHVIQNAFS
ncbi:MAG: ISAs1 family transposase [Aureispira sp.]